MKKKNKCLIIITILAVLLIAGIIIISKTNIFRKTATKLQKNRWNYYCSNYERYNNIR